jgi:Cu-Zn family superoxide dismutase
MLSRIRSVMVVVLAAGFMWSCGGERGMEPSGVEEQIGRPLSKIAVAGGSMSQAMVVATVSQDDAPVAGVMVEFARSVAGQVPDYQWSGMTDDMGRVTIEISGRATGYYQARASQDGSVMGRWLSIPINGGYTSTVALPIGGRAEVTGTSELITAVMATATIGETNESGVAGKAVFTQIGDNIKLVVSLANASAGEHGVHIHAIGDCSAPDGKSAGGHWNPTGVAHGKWGEGEFHLGDIGNMTVDDQGMGKIELTTNLWEMNTGSDIDIVGKAIIVHAGADDFVSQPSGNAGARIGCGVIELGQ